jgi:hypothetical protein
MSCPGNLDNLDHEIRFLEPRQRLVVLPSTNDGVRQHPRPGEASLNGQLDCRCNENLCGIVANAVSADELRIDELDDDTRRRSSLQYAARLLTDPLEGVETFSLHLLRDHLDDHTWQMVAERLAHGFFACVFSDGLLVIWLCNRLLDRLGRLSSQREHENGQRKLRIVLRQPLGFLPQQAPLELLVLFLQKNNELAILVALLLELRVGQSENADSLLQRAPIFLIDHVHRNHECKNAIDLSSGVCGMRSFFSTRLVLRATHHRAASPAPRR